MAKGGFPGMGGGNNMQQLVRQAQKMQEDVAKVQEEIGNREFTATAGGGAVTVVITGKKEVKSIVISPDCVDPDDIETLQDIVVAAVNEAIRTAEDTMNEAISKVTGGMAGLF